jgi:Xaa-Pro aminopeptidase
LSFFKKGKKKMLQALRAQLALENVDAFLLPSIDPHGSEYTAERFHLLEAVSGFGGSVGTVVVTSDRALLFCDPRYWEEAANTVVEGFEVMKTGGSDNVTVIGWLENNLRKNSHLSVDARRYTPNALEKLETSLPLVRVTALDYNFVERVWTTKRPELPAVACWVHPDTLAGQTVAKKLEKLREELKNEDCCAIVISALDESMWLFNLRGGDITESPVAYAFSVVTPKEALFYVMGGTERVSQEVCLLVLCYFPFLVISVASFPLFSFCFPFRYISVDDC